MLSNSSSKRVTLYEASGMIMAVREQVALVGDHARQEVIEKQALDELAAASDANLLEGVLQVALDSVLGDVKRPRNTLGGEALGHKPHDFRLPFCRRIWKEGAELLKYVHEQRLVKIRESRGPELTRIEELLDRFNVFGTISTN